VVNLVDPAGVRVTGLTNEVGDETPFNSRCSDTPLPYNPSGMDVEDLALLPSGKFLGVEENKPSIFVGDLKTGVVERRYTPAGRTLPGAGYGVSDRLPAILRNRRANGGFESVTVSPDGRVAYTATQNPLGPAAIGSPYRNSRVLRILRLDVSDPYDLQVTGQFIVLMSDRSLYPATIGQRLLKLSAMSWVAPDILLLLERSDEPARGGVRLILVDLRRATNVHGWPVAGTLTLEDAATDLAALGITPAGTDVVFQELETDEARIFSTYKLEGMAILNGTDVAIINDNDFGILAPDSPTRLWVLRLAARLEAGDVSRTIPYQSAGR
jgi:alkaline phosphatase